MKHLETEEPGNLNIIEIFSSIQGETSLTGLPTTFIRLAACNLRCTWCDTAYSFGRGKKISQEEIIQQTSSNGLPHVCITGGEPLLQKNVYPLMKTLCDLGYTLSLETGGSLPVDEVDPRVITILDIKCPGSGMNEKNHLGNLKRLREHDEIKFVLLNENDYAFALDICKKFQLFSRTKPVLFSPVFGKLDPKKVVQWILQDKIHARLNLQIHKFIWHPETTGV